MLAHLVQYIDFLPPQSFRELDRYWLPWLIQCIGQTMSHIGTHH
jgi:hypothetical protein